MKLYLQLHRAVDPIFIFQIYNIFATYVWFWGPSKLLENSVCYKAKK